jgi:hypothetical protein
LMVTRGGGMDVVAAVRVVDVVGERVDGKVG